MVDNPFRPNRNDHTFTVRHTFSLLRTRKQQLANSYFYRHDTTYQCKNNSDSLSHGYESHIRLNQNPTTTTHRLISNATRRLSIFSRIPIVYPCCFHNHTIHKHAPLARCGWRQNRHLLVRTCIPSQYPRTKNCVFSAHATPFSTHGRSHPVG